MTTLKDDRNKPLRAQCPLKILIVGAGITGLTSALALSLTGHTVIIYEAAQSLTEIGAGLQIAPNASRILARLGILGEVIKKANVLEGLSLRRWEDDKEIGRAPLMPDVGERYGAPLCVIHRADLQAILLQTLKSLPNPVKIHLGTKVLAPSLLFNGCIQLESGEWVEGDVVICADGVKSLMRRYILRPDEKSNDGKSKVDYPLQGDPGSRAKKFAGNLGPRPTGDAAYRVLIPRSKLEGNKNALELLNTNIGMRWMGPGGHVMAYPLRNNTLYNIVLLHPHEPQSRSPSPTDESWTRKGSKTEMLSCYASWNSTINSLLSYVPDGNVVEWNLYTHPPLPTWVKGKCVLVGDAAHPMLPYVAQGAAQGIEDAGVIACLLSKIGSVDEIEHALKVFEGVRKERAERIQSSAAETRRVLHLVDGEEQSERDSIIRTVSGRAKGEGNEEDGEGGNGRNPDLWADEKWQTYMWGVDIMREALDAWESR
ncbi:FAD/NAD(P)-binding domain-containing protein [Stipitochalara longipes BDJ]|nr:FAD/NAD(P)-binding domain-containing protein [Stipitochalara longipes BDJ]